ncbi:hypothetical protein D3C71_2200900 [compost metagenome]
MLERQRTDVIAQIMIAYLAGKSDHRAIIVALRQPLVFVADAERRFTHADTGIFHS